MYLGSDQLDELLRSQNSVLVLVKLLELGDSLFRREIGTHLQSKIEAWQQKRHLSSRGYCLVMHQSHVSKHGRDERKGLLTWG